jgi:hypothetical protein
MRPYAPLKRGCLNIQRERGIQTLATHLAKQIFFPGLHGFVVTPADGEGEFMSQSLLEFVVGVRELDGANPLIGRRD